MSDQSTLYRMAITDDWVDDPRDVIEDLIADGALIPVTEALLTREEAANDEQVQRRVLQMHGLGWMLEADDE